MKEGERETEVEKLGTAGLKKEKRETVRGTAGKNGEQEVREWQRRREETASEKHSCRCQLCLRSNFSPSTVKAPAFSWCLNVISGFLGEEFLIIF